MTCRSQEGASLRGQGLR